MKTPVLILVLLILAVVGYFYFNPATPSAGVDESTATTDQAPPATPVAAALARGASQPGPAPSPGSGPRPPPPTVGTGSANPAAAAMAPPPPSVGGAGPMPTTATSTPVPAAPPPPAAKPSIKGDINAFTDYATGATPMKVKRQAQDKLQKLGGAHSAELDRELAK